MGGIVPWKNYRGNIVIVGEEWQILAACRLSSPFAVGPLTA
jgi:hypothetical protein